MCLHYLEVGLLGSFTLESTLVRYSYALGKLAAYSGMIRLLHKVTHTVLRDLVD